MNEDNWPKIRFSSDCPSLPADRPSRYPRIVDLTSFNKTTDEVDKTGLAGADGVATFLWNWDRTQFDRFFDLTRKQFDLHYQGPKGSVESMVISRNDRTVIVCCMATLIVSDADLCGRRASVSA